MIRLTEFFNKSNFKLGNENINLGKVYSDPRVRAFAPTPQITEDENSEDHEVSMAQNQLDSIIKHATELKGKMGEEEKQIPAWIQDHITNSENYISQAASNYHEYGDSNESKDLTNYDEVKVLSKEEFENEAVAKTTGEKIQNLNDRIKKLRDKITATKNPEQKMKLQNTLKNALQSLSNKRKEMSIKAPHAESVVNEMGPNDTHLKSIISMFDRGGDFTKKKVGVAVAKNPKASRNQIMSDLRDMDYDDIVAVEKELGIKEIAEGKYDNELDKITSAVEKASSFMSVGGELKKIGVKYDFSTSMIPMYRIKVPGNTIAIVNKKYAAGAEREVGEIAIGLMEGLVTEDFKHIISVDTPTQVVSKPVAAQIEKLAKSGVRSKDIGLKMGFVGNQKLATDEFQKLKNKIYFALHKTESVKEAKKYDIGSGYMGNGLTIWNRAEEENGDYRIIAHISPDGKLSIRDNQLPADLKKTFQIWADSMKKGNMGPKY